MAGFSDMNGSMHVPVRSISLPCRVHPNSLKIEAVLTQLKSSSSTSDVETLRVSLTRLAELFICIDELARSTRTRKSFHHHHVNQVDDALDGSVELMDVCSAARELFLTMKDHIQDLQSSFRRRGNDSSTERYIQAYISFRKRAKKDIAKSITTLKRLKRNTAASFPMHSEEHPLAYLMKLTKEAHEITVSIFQSVLLFLSLPLMETRRWSLISKLIRSGFIDSGKDQKIFNEVGRLDIEIFSRNRKNDAKIDVQERLERAGGSINGIETELGSVFRCLIQNRVSLLNLVNA